MKSKKFPKAPKLPDPTPNFILAMIIIVLVAAAIGLNEIAPGVVSIWTVVGSILVLGAIAWVTIQNIFGGE